MIMKYLVFILFLIVAFCTVPAINGWAFRQYLGFAFISILISIMLTKKFHISVGLCFFITTLYGLFRSGIPQFGSEVVSSIMVLLLFSCISLGFSESLLNLILPALALVAIGDAIIMLVRFLMHFEYMDVYWVLTNASLDASFIALMFPIVWILGQKKSVQIPLSIFIVLAVVAAKSNTALLVLVITGISLFWEALVLVPLSYFALGHKFAHSEGRIDNWKIMMGFWQDHVNHLFGSGPGTYWILAQSIQAHKAGDQVWGWMHNDFLQVLFEQGLIGLGSVLFLYFMMLWKSFKKPILLSMVIGYGVIAMTLYPIHLFFFQLIGLALIALCFNREGHYDRTPILQ